MNEQQTPVSAPVTEPVTAPQAQPVSAPNPAPETLPASPAPVAEPVPTPAQPASVAAPAATEPDYRALYENLRRENEILRHNAEITQHAPVQGVSGGGAVSAPVDDFIRGFDSDTWD